MKSLDDKALQDRLQPLLAAKTAAWLWDWDQNAILWANRSGVAFWGDVDLVRLTERRFDRAMPAVARLRSLVDEDFRNGEITAKLLFWTHGNPREISCRIDLIVLESGERVLLLIESGSESSAKNFDAYRRLNGGESGGRNVINASAASPPSEASGHMRRRWRTPPQPLLDDQDRFALKEIASLLRSPQERYPKSFGEIRPDRTISGEFSADAGNGREIGQNGLPDTPLSAAWIGHTAVSLFETLPVGFCICREGEMIFANSVLAYAFGYDTPNNLLDGGGLKALFPTESAFTDQDNDGSGPAFRTKTLTARTRSGRRLQVIALLGETLFDPKPVRVVLIVPLNWRGNMETTEETSAPLPNDAVHQLVDGFLTLDKNGRVLHAQTSLEIPLEGFAGRHLNEIFSEKDWPKISRALHRLGYRAPAFGQIEILQTNLRAAVSPADPIGLRLGRLDEAGPARYWAAIVDFRQSPGSEPGKEEKSDTRHSGEGSASADVLAKISHEVRTPLNSIIGFAEIMKDERFGPVGHAKYQGYLSDIYDSAHHALSLINDLLDISKLKAGAFEGAPSPVDVNRTIEQCLRTLRPQAEQARIVIRSSLTAGLPPLSVDERCLKQILLNLISNGIKFTDSGGHVIARTLRNEDGGLKIRIRDTGIGMSDDEIAQAVQPFLQLDTTPRQQIGSGLGLPLAKALAEANDAAFSITSMPGKGTQVDLDFAATRLLPIAPDGMPGEKSTL